MNGKREVRYRRPARRDKPNNPKSLIGNPCENPRKRKKNWLIIICPLGWKGRRSGEGGQLKHPAANLLS
jgi:hypothetical protein